MIKEQKGKRRPDHIENTIVREKATLQLNSMVKSKLFELSIIVTNNCP